MKALIIGGTGPTGRMPLWSKAKKRAASATSFARPNRQLGYSDRVDAESAVRQMVQWVKDHPPDNEAYVEGLRAHYEVEDQLARIVRDANERMAALPHIESTFHHTYAHPREPGLQRDHRGR